MNLIHTSSVNCKSRPNKLTKIKYLPQPQIKYHHGFKLYHNFLDGRPVWRAIMDAEEKVGKFEYEVLLPKSTIREKSLKYTKELKEKCLNGEINIKCNIPLNQLDDQTIKNLYFIEHGKSYYFDCMFKWLENTVGPRSSLFDPKPTWFYVNRSLAKIDGAKPQKEGKYFCFKNKEDAFTFKMYWI